MLCIRIVGGYCFAKTPRVREAVVDQDRCRYDPVLVRIMVLLPGRPSPLLTTCGVNMGKKLEAEKGGIRTDIRNESVASSFSAVLLTLGLVASGPANLSIHDLKSTTMSGPPGGRLMTLTKCSTRVVINLGRSYARYSFAGREVCRCSVLVIPVACSRWIWRI